MKNNKPSRIEYKYLIPDRIRSSVLTDLLQFMHVDQHGNLPDRSYKVASIYFEDHALTSYHEKIEGRPYRKKFRVRFYPQLTGSGGNLEVKCKLIDKGFKVKVALSETAIGNLLNGDINECLEEIKDSSLELVLAEMKANGLKPFVRIDYRRVAMFSKTDSSVRVTLDSDIKASRVMENQRILPYIPIVPRGLEVLEVKSDSLFPFYLCRLVRKYSLKRFAVSKYAFAVQNIGLNSAMSLK